MKICKDGRIWGQNNEEAGDHLGVPCPKRIKSGSSRGSKNPFYGKHHSVETRRKMSKAKIGDNHPLWKGGISGEAMLERMGLECKLWREAVFARDNWTCQECGGQGDRLNAHHIKSFAEFPELRFAIDNGKTLCHECHKLTANFKGKREKKEQWIT